MPVRPCRVSPARKETRTSTSCPPASFRRLARSSIFSRRFEVAATRRDVSTTLASDRPTTPVLHALRQFASRSLFFNLFYPDVRENGRLQPRGHVGGDAEAHVCGIFDPHVFHGAKLLQIPPGFARIHREPAALTHDAQTRRSVHVDERLISALIRDPAELQ